MRKRTWKKALAMALVFVFVIQIGTTYAEPIQELEQQVEDIETKIQKLDDKIVQSIVKVEGLEKKIKDSEKNIASTEEKIAVAEQELAEMLSASEERLRSMQRSESNRFLEFLDILLSSQGLSDFIQRTQALSVIIDSDKKLIDSLAEKDQQLKELKAELDQELATLQKQKKQAEDEKKSIERQKEEVKQELARVKELLEEQRRIERERQEAAARAQTRNNAQTTQQVVNYVQPDYTHVEYDSEIVTRLIAEAKKHQGVPYRWGGTSPSGFDCSGFVQYVYRSVGINLPRVTYTQQNMGVPVSLNQLQPGDLIFRGNPSHHVGIYIGNNQYIHAPYTGTVVRIETFNPAKFTFARRIINQ